MSETFDVRERRQSAERIAALEAEVARLTRVNAQILEALESAADLLERTGYGNGPCVADARDAIAAARGEGER